jgi:hypothetical protein
VIVFTTQDTATIATQVVEHTQRIGPEVAVILALGVGPAAGHTAAAYRSADSWRSLDSINIVAPGLPRLELSHRRHRPAEHSDEALSAEAWSRTIGALGDEVWRRINELHVVVVGCGRTGSLLSAGLRRAALRKMTLIDADRIEPHNLGEMDGVDLDDLSRTKVEAVAQRLESQRLPCCCTVNALPESVLSLSALVAIKEAD